jgi:2'-5' RNA ligase
VAETDERIRAFLAVDLSDTVREQVRALVGRLKPELPGVSWTRPDNLHLTLRFFGNVAPAAVDEFAAALRPVAAQFAPVDACVSGVGAFPSLRRPSVFWVGMSFTTDAVNAVQSEAERLARRAGLDPETRPFVPHVTIGRMRRNARRVNAAAVLERERDFSAGAFTVEAVSLFSSELTPDGARYTRLHRLTFDGIRGERVL